MMDIERRQVGLLFGLAGLLAGCATLDKGAITLAGDIGMTASQAAALFGFVKGAAIVAEGLEPQYAALIAIAMAAIAPDMAAITAGLATPTQVASVTAQSIALLLTIANSIKIVPGVA